MKLRLQEAERRDGLAILRTSLPPQEHAVQLRYRTRTGALLRVDGIAAGAFDREHHDVQIPPADFAREVTLEVELYSLPTNGLPPGPGIWWWLVQAGARQRPSNTLEIGPLPPAARTQDAAPRQIEFVGHSHLDIAWLWTYEQTRRKALRTFAIACDLLDRDPEFRFAQSQPQLYRFVEEGDPELFERVRQEVAAGRFDCDVAALWVESDCNIPSGESLLRQITYAHRFCLERFDRAPAIAWLPDSFGFANTLPQLLAHAQIPYFMTTKLQWNDTTRFPYPQFVWEGPDGSSAIAALIASYDGPPRPSRVRIAQERKEPIVAGYGDGGGGVSSNMLAQVRELGRWIRPREWFDAVAARRDDLPRHRDELYLEYHRGTYTTHHDVKFSNALLENALSVAEELCAWCVAIHAPREAVEHLRERLRRAWEIVLRNQFHDVLPGTAIADVYADVAQEYSEAAALVSEVVASAERILPRSHSAPVIEPAQPIEQPDGFLFENGLLSARIRRDGALDYLSLPAERNVVAEANRLTIYRDRPRRWEAWNVDDGYQSSGKIVRAAETRIEEDSVALEYQFGSSRALARVSLRSGEPFLRIDLEVDWRERRRLLRAESEFAFEADSALFGSPHGSIARGTAMKTPQERAKFEVPGQRFAAVRGPEGEGAAVFALDTYGWSACAGASSLRLGHSLLRGTTWPDPDADLGDHRIRYAFAPFSNASIGALEHAWLRFARDPRVRLFTTPDDSILVVACKPADDGDGVVLRVRECDGAARTARMRCGARMQNVNCVDAIERALDRTALVEGEDLVFDLKPFELRSFRVRFT